MNDDEQRFIDEFDYLFDNACSNDGSEECLRCKKVLMLANGLSGLRRGQEVCFCGNCMVPLTMADIDQATQAVSHLDSLTENWHLYQPDSS